MDSAEAASGDLLGSAQEALRYRRHHHGLIGVGSKVPVRDSSMLSLLYTPGVAEACAAVETGVAAVAVGPEVVEANTRGFIYEGHLGDQST